jgi:hypothetical protein
MRLSLIVACVTLAAGSGACSDPDTLTCAWLAGPDNCWANTALMATTCLPPESETGTLSADAATCSYPSGSLITFMPPLVIPVPDQPAWNFSVTGVNSQPCLQYQDSGPGGTTLTVGAQIVRIGGSGGLGMSIACPDGTSVKTENAFNLLDCPGSILAIPGLIKSWSDTGGIFVSAGIITGREADGSVAVFDCSR